MRVVIQILSITFIYSSYAMAHSVTVAAQVFSFLAVVLQLPVLFWHSKQKNVATVCLVVWFALLNLNTFIVGFVWSSPDLYGWWNGEIYGDVVIRILATAHTGVICATIANSRNLSRLMSRKAPLLHLNSFSNRMIDLIICLAIPLLLMALIVVVTRYRYGLVQYQGPVIILAPTWVTIVLYAMWPVILSVVSVVYAGLALFRYFQRRADFKDLLHTTNSGMSASKFVRLLVYVSIIALVMLPLTIYFFTQNVAAQLYPFSWDAAHSQYNDIPRYLGMQPVADQWIYISFAVIQFLCFGTGKEMIGIYKKCFGRLRIFCGLQSKKKEPSLYSMSSPILPSSLLPRSPGSLSEFTMDIKVEQSKKSDRINSSED
ncbi:pheromone a factor receptor [Trichomonascus vanleenenianus]|uniref:Ste3p n=1 Tax=Trichomonascus vanleenenianus TaxID=2268995 RepID=UPI003ECB0D66